MNDRTLLSARVAECNANSLSVQFPSPETVNPSDECSLPCQTETTEPFTDEAREQAAYRAGCAMQAWYARYQHTGNPAFLDNAYQALGLMRKLLAGRSAEKVAQMEAERGLT